MRRARVIGHTGCTKFAPRSTVDDDEVDDLSVTRRTFVGTARKRAAAIGLLNSDAAAAQAAASTTAPMPCFM